MCFFSEFDFTKLNLVNFDKLVTIDGEELPGFAFIKHFNLVKDPLQHPCIDYRCEGKMIRTKRTELKLKYRYNCNKCEQVINIAQCTWFSNSRLSILQSLKLFSLF